MAYQGRVRLALTADEARRHFPSLDTWLRMNPQWSLSAITPSIEPEALNLRLHLEREDQDEDHVARFFVLSKGWRLELSREGVTRRIELELHDLGAQCELSMTDAGIPESDGPARTEMALWLKATGGYAQLAAAHRLRSRLGKWLLDRIWLRMSMTGRRVVLLILAYEIVGLAFLIAWMLWERFAP